MAALKIVARKPRDLAAPDSIEYVVVDRGDGVGHRYVVGSATPRSLADGEWFWGHYFRTLPEALADFNDR